MSSTEEVAATISNQVSMEDTDYDDDNKKTAAAKEVGNMHTSYIICYDFNLPYTRSICLFL